jgi:hypothetical protein
MTRPSSERGSCRTTLYYDPAGRCEGAYVEVAEGRAVAKVEPDPRYLVAVYFDEERRPLGIRIWERAPESVLEKAVALVTDAPTGLRRRVADARATLAA